MSVVEKRSKILFLPNIRGNYGTELTKNTKLVMEEVISELNISAIIPESNNYTEGVIHKEDNLRAYWENFKNQLYDIKGLIAFSGDFMWERTIQEAIKLLPEDVPVFLVVNNDNPYDMSKGMVGDSLCGSMSVNYNARMLGRKVIKTYRINMQDKDLLKKYIAEQVRIIDGIEEMRSMRIGMIGTNPYAFATSFTNQVKLFELGFTIQPYELIDLWGDTVIARNIEEGEMIYNGDFGSIKLRWPIAKNDPRVVETIEAMKQTMNSDFIEEDKYDLMARCFLWIKDTFEREFVDTGAIHCWSEFGRYFNISPCAFAMFANLLLEKPVVCETDICHSIIAKLAWAMTGEPGVILDINNNGWDNRVFNVFHCSQTPPNWLEDGGKVNGGCGVSGAFKAVPFTAVCASTTADSAETIVFQGQFLDTHPTERGSSGWAFVPNMPDVIEAFEKHGLHHFVTMKGHIGNQVAIALDFRGFDVYNLSESVPALNEINKILKPLDGSMSQGQMEFGKL